MSFECSKCKAELDGYSAYEYRGIYSCERCFDAVVESRDYERREVMWEENIKTKPFEGLDIDPRSPIGKVNREILAANIEIASKESYRLKKYEGRE